MNPFKERKAFLNALGALKPQKRVSVPTEVPEKLFVTCPSCAKNHTKKVLSDAFYVCPACGHHHRVPAYYRLRFLFDEGNYHELNRRLAGKNPLGFPGYEEKLAALREETGLNEAIVTAVGKIDGIKAVVCVLDSRFLMGSMGAAVGEKVTRAAEHATARRLPLIIFSASCGARMQEGILSLFQMAKTAAALEQHAAAGLLYISVLTHPTTGGVTASFASLGDIILAEPHALIGFAGPRVIEQTIKQTLPEGFQSAEYLLAHGFVDAIVPRGELPKTLSTLLKLHTGRSGA